MKNLKKLMILSLVMLMSTAAFSQVSVGGGLTMGTKMGVDDDGDDKIGFGINARAFYDINDKFGITGGFTYFFPSAPEGMDLKAWQLNADATYSFYEAGDFTLYGLAGLNYSYAKAEVEVMGFSAEADDSEIGLDLGIGAKSEMGLFGELKYDTAYEQLAITVGFVFGL